MIIAFLMYRFGLLVCLVVHNVKDFKVYKYHISIFFSCYFDSMKSCLTSAAVDEVPEHGQLKANDVL